MKAIERAAITRILFDIIKADKVIDSREMDLYRGLKDQFKIMREDEIAAYGMTLSRAVAVIKEMDGHAPLDLMGTFESMTASDGYCPREEALLMLMLHFCLRNVELDCDVISVRIDEAWFDDSQVLYIESRHHKEINHSIATNLRAISRELRLCGFDFVYLPEIVRHYIATPKELLSEVASMLLPSLTSDDVAGLLTKIKLFKTDTFCIEQLHHKLGFEELIDTPPALMLRINQSRVGNDIYTNFLRIELTPNVLEIVQALADTFIGYNSSDSMVVSNKIDEKGRFLYMGFYRQVFEILMLQKAMMCHVTVDFVHDKILLKEFNAELKMHRKEKALYVLFIYEMRNGGISFTPPQSAAQLQKYNKRMQQLQRRYAKIYGAFGGNENSAPDITRAEIRQPMFTGIRKAISCHAEKIYDANRFIINRDKFGIYGISAVPDVFESIECSTPAPISIFDSSLFASLDC